MNQSLKDKLPLITLIVATLVLLLLAFSGGRKYQEKKMSAAEEYLQGQIVEAQSSAEYWRGLFENTQAEGEQLLLKIDSLENRIKNIKEDYGQKITVIKSYTNPELERFFTERYGSL